MPATGPNSSGKALVLGALRDRRVGCPDIFVESLIASGANADLVVFTCDIDPKTEAYLRSRGATLIPFRFHRWWHGPVHTWRFVLFARYAAKHFRDYDYIMTSDLRDVVLQSNPFAAIGEDRRVRFFLESDRYTLGTEKYYARWMRMFIPAQYHSAYAPARVSCCGVTLGGTREMADYLAALANRIRKVSLLRRRIIGADSAFHNLIAHVTHDVPGILVENNDLVATMGLEPPGSYRIGSDGLIECGDGRVPAICHQYDRTPEFAAAMRARFASDSACREDGKAAA